jgi:hypothetical protein
MVLNRMSTRKASEYVIAIPSYKRVETLKMKTLAVLAKYKIPAKKIYIFVANKEEEAVYKAGLEPGTYNKIVVGVPKIGPQRMFIMRHFPVGKPLVQIDDDVSSFIEYDAKAKRHERPLRDLDATIRRGFRLCKEVGCGCWGIYPTANGFFMKPGYTTDLRFLIGVMTGCFNPGTMKLHCESFKEDYERTLKFYERDGAVIRMNDIAPKTSYYTEKGGAEEFRDWKPMEAEAKWLESEYPDLVKIRWIKREKYSSKHLYPDVRLKSTKEHT